jgi:choline/glycine/proline betaine transport protein
MQTMVVLAGLPFSVVLILFMFGLHKAMRQDTHRTGTGRIGRTWPSWFQRAPDCPGPATEPSRGAALHGQTRDPGAGRSRRAICAAQGLDVQTLLGKSKRCMGVRIEMEGNPFVYEVSLDGYLAAPSESIEADEEKCAAVTTAPRCTCTTAARSTT